MCSRTAPAFYASVALVLLAAPPVMAQDSGVVGRDDALRQHHPALHDLVGRLEAAHAVLFAGLAREGEAVRTRGGRTPTVGFEIDMVDRLTALVRGQAANGTVDETVNDPADHAVDDATAADHAVSDATAAGYAALGPRGAEVVRRGQSFQREVISILADPAVADPRVALADAVNRYRSRPGVALPGVPKDMGVLYGHEHALDFRTNYPDLDGLVWAGHWLRLAATEPFTDIPAGPQRVAGVDTVTTRYHAKLSHGEPPHSFPSELPLAPAIAPGLIWLSPESAMIWDNLSLLLEVLADVLVSSETTDVAQATSATLDFFLDPDLAVTDRDEWEIMALRHGIFFQGGYPLTLMTKSERNADGHAAHLSSGGRVMMPGMPRR